MAKDIEMTNGKPAIAAARLCNFHTGKFTLLDSHQKWIDQIIVPILRTQPETWIELVGYASRRGEFQLNDYLSFERCEAVKRRLDDYNVIFQTEWKGESESGVNERDNDGYWRAAEIYVLHNEPVSTPPPPPPVKPPSVNRLFHRSFLSFKVEANDWGRGPREKEEFFQEGVKGLVGFGL